MVNLPPPMVLGGLVHLPSHNNFNGNNATAAFPEQQTNENMFTSYSSTKKYKSHLKHKTAELQQTSSIINSHREPGA